MNTLDAKCVLETALICAAQPLQVREMEVLFDGVLSACVFAWEERAEASSRFMRTEIQRYLDQYPTR